MVSIGNPSYIGLRQAIAGIVPADALLIVDVGAADGTLGEYLIRLREDRQVIGVEANPHLAARAAARLTEVLNVDVESLAWETVARGSRIDCLIFADVLEHLREPVAVLTRASRHLADDGVAIISLPNIRHISAFWEIFVRGRFPRRTRGLFDENHLRWFTPADVRRLCTGSALEILSIDYELRLRDNPGGAVNKALRSQRWIGHVPVIREFLAYQIVVSARPIGS